MADKVYGPYKGSKQNGGRKIYVIRKEDGSTTSVNKARKDYEDKTGKKLDKKTHVDHKDNNKSNDSKSNLQAMSAKKNIGKENKRRAGK
jgi:ribosome biogenesis GTPase A